LRFFCFCCVWRRWIEDGPSSGVKVPARPTMTYSETLLDFLPSELKTRVLNTKNTKYLKEALECLLHFALLPADVEDVTTPFSWCETRRLWSEQLQTLHGRGAVVQNGALKRCLPNVVSRMVFLRRLEWTSLLGRCLDFRHCLELQVVGELANRPESAR